MLVCSPSAPEVPEKAVYKMRIYLSSWFQSHWSQFVDRSIVLDLEQAELGGAAWLTPGRLRTSEK